MYKDDEVRISIGELFQTMWSLRWLVLILTGIGMGVGLLLTGLNQQPSYETKASLFVNSKINNQYYRDEKSSPDASDMLLSQTLAETLLQFVKSNRVLEEVAASFPDIDIELLRDSLAVHSVENTSFMTLTLRWESPDEAVDILNKIMEVLPGVMMEIMDIGSVNVIDYAKSAEPVSKQSIRYILIGTVGGALLGCLVVLLVYILVPKIRSKENLEEMLLLGVIGEIPAVEHKRKSEYSCLLDQGKLMPDYREAYGVLTSIFLYLTEKDKKKIIAISSSVPNEGKSTLVYNLAYKLNETGRKVLVLDFDFKYGTLGKLMGLENLSVKKVEERMNQGESLEEMLIQLDSGVFTIRGFREKEVMKQDNMIFRAIAVLKDSFDYILIDTPPVCPISEVMYLRELIDGLVFVVRHGSTGMGSVMDAVNKLKKIDAPIIGCVLNGIKSAGPVYGYYRNYQDYYQD